MVGLRDDFRGTDRFLVENRLGEGGFGVVYQVYDRKRKERVALKTLHRLDAEGLYRFKKEFRILADVSNSRLVALHELFADSDTWFYTMDLVQGTDILSFVGSVAEEPEDSLPIDELGITSPIPAGSDNLEEVEDESSLIHSAAEPASPCVLEEDRLRWAFSELAAGVESLHETGRLHRDIKPSNVLVSNDGRVVLLDFGLATERGVSHSSTNQVVGTIAYMAPEQATGAELTRAADWYGVGAILYEALTGKLPFTGREFQVLLAKQQADPVPPAQLVETTPKVLSDLAMALLVRDPTKRAAGDEIRRVLGSVETPQSALESLAPAYSCEEKDDEDLIGREQEISALRDAYAAARSKGPVVVEVQGASGMGKTALLSGFLGPLARTTDAVILSGRCYKQESVPFKAVDNVIDALCHHLRTLDLATANALMPRDVRALARLFPVLERVKAVREAPAGAGDVPDIQELRQRAFGALAELLARIADRQPLVIAIDDLQWGDMDSAVLLGKLLADADPPRMLLILSYRSEERERSPFLEELLGGAALRAVTQEVEVGVLDRAAALTLTRVLLGDDSASDERCQAIVAESRRNPLFIHALTRYADKLQGGDTLTFEGVVGHVVATLPDASQRLMEIAAVAGQPITPTVALRAAGLGGEDAEGSKALAVLRSSRLVRSCGSTEELVECYHDRLREAVLGDLRETRLCECHRALAEALDASIQDDPERLAFHLEGAGEVEKAAENAEKAADQAAEKLAFERAAGLYETALTHAKLDSVGEHSLRVKLGDAWANAGRGAEAAKEYLAAAQGVPRVEALELRRRAALQLLGSGLFDKGHEVMRTVLADLGMKLPRSTRRALLSGLAQQAHLRIRGRGYHERGESRIPAEDLLRLDVCWAAAQGFRMTEATYSLTFTSKFIRLALETGEPYRVSLALSLDATTLVMLSQSPSAFRRAEELLDRAGSLARRIDSPRAIAFNLSAAATVATFRGRWREALERSEQAITVFREQTTGSTLELTQTQLFIINAWFYQGRLREFRRIPGLIQEARARGDLFASIGYLGGFGFLAWLGSDDEKTTRRELARARAAWPVEGYLLQNWMLDQAEIYTALYLGWGRAAHAQITEALRPFKRTPYWHTDWLRSHATTILGLAAIAAAIEVGERSPRRGRLLREATQCARKLDRYPFPAATPWGQLLDAQIAYLQGKQRRASTLLISAEDGFVAADMPLYVTLTRRCRGIVIHGDRGRKLVAEADEELASRGAARPERIAAMLAPGLARR